MGTIEPRAFQIRGPEVCLGQIAVPQDRSTQYGAEENTSARPCALERCAGEIRLEQVCVGQINLPIGPDSKVGVLEVASLEIGVLEGRRVTEPVRQELLQVARRDIAE